MKNLILITILFFALLSCKAQNPIVSIDKGKFETIEGAYFKDLNYELNKFEGTWIFSDNLNILTISLVKKEQVPDGEYYEDILVGEYKYVENGNEIVNTLPSLILNPENIINRNIGGNYIIPNNLYVACDDCTPDERRVKLYFSDPERPYLSVSIVLRYIQDGNVPGQDAQITATIFPHGGMLPDENSPSTIRVPYGEYLMVKE